MLYDAELPVRQLARLAIKILWHYELEVAGWLCRLCGVLLVLLLLLLHLSELLVCTAGLGLCITNMSLLGGQRLLNCGQLTGHGRHTICHFHRCRKQAIRVVFLVGVLDVLCQLTHS